PGRRDVVAVTDPGNGLTGDRPLALLERHDVRDDLAGMALVGQAVDHRHGGVARKLHHTLVRVGADHDDVDVAGQHARRIGDRLSAPELQVGMIKCNGLAAELPHRDIERHARAGRGFLEDHYQHGMLDAFGAEPRRHHFAGALHLVRDIHDAPQGCGIDVTNIYEMAWGHVSTSRIGGLRRQAWVVEMRRSASDKRDRPSAISASVMLSGGSNRSTLSPAETASSFSAAQAATTSATGGFSWSPVSRPTPRTSSTTPANSSSIRTSSCLNRIASC